MSNPESAHVGIDKQNMLTILDDLTTDVDDKLTQLANNDELNVTDMFELQFAANKLSVASEAFTGVTAGLQAANMSMSRNLK